MTFNDIRGQIPDFGRDTRLNLESVLTEEGAPGLTRAQIFGIALASSYALTAPSLIAAILSEGGLSDATVEASKSAATIMAMNNVYYRSMHLMEDAELKKMPARLRMGVIGKPGIEKVDFELMCFAVSALAGCGQCLTAHLHELRKAGVSNEGAQSALRIAAAFNAADRALRIAGI
ncbi:MAG: carboxymuconolactone decarboxylase family protein [Bdellovibrionales bacterium]